MVSRIVAPATAYPSRSQQRRRGRIIAVLEAHPGLVHASDPAGRTALHWAAERVWYRLATWLLDHGADVNARATNGDPPIDLVARDVDSSPLDPTQGSSRLADLLLGRGARRTVRWAVASGDAAWLRARHREGRLIEAKDIVSHAVRSGREDMVHLLLELGLDPDESGVLDGADDVGPTWGGPLRECAIGGRVALARILLAHAANANTNVSASSSALYGARWATRRRRSCSWRSIGLTGRSMIPGGIGSSRTDCTRQHARTTSGWCSDVPVAEAKHMLVHGGRRQDIRHSRIWNMKG